MALNDWESLSRNEQLQVHIVFLNMLVHYSGAIEQENLPGVKQLIPGFENNVLGLLTTLAVHLGGGPCGRCLHHR